MVTDAEQPTVPASDSPGGGETTSAPTTGQSWGKFLIEKRLGGGGQAEVYQAFDQVGTAGHVALKVPTHPVTAEFVRAWIDTEAGALVKLQHPNVVRVLDAGTAGGRPYVATELVQGLPLTQYVRLHSPAPRQAGEWTAQLADALHTAHQLGIVHRDVKPLNVVVTAEGRPMLIDFGVASLVSAYKADHRQDGTGTHSFIAPEQARRSPNADHRVDVFGLGALLKYLLAGEGPYHGKGRALDAALRGDVSPLPAYGSGLKARLCRIANRALDADPDRRFRNAHEMAVALRRALGRRRLLLMGGAAAVLAALLAAGAWMLSNRGAQEPAGAGEVPLQAAAQEPLRRQGMLIHVQPRLRPGATHTLGPETVPLLRGDGLRIHARFERPLRAFVLRLSTAGEPELLYPPAGAGGGPVAEFHLPASPGEYLKINNPGGTETFVLVAREDALPDGGQSLLKLAHACAAPRLKGPVVLYSDGRRIHMAQGKRRAAAGATVTVDRGGLDFFLARVSEQADLVQVTAFPVVSGEAIRERAAQRLGGRGDASPGGRGSRRPRIAPPRQ